MFHDLDCKFLISWEFFCQKLVCQISPHWLSPFDNILYKYFSHFSAKIFEASKPQILINFSFWKYKRYKYQKELSTTGRLLCYYKYINRESLNPYKILILVI